MSDCKEGEPCAEYHGLVLAGRLWQIHLGIAEGLSKEQCEAYRELWRRKPQEFPVKRQRLSLDEQVARFLAAQSTFSRKVSRLIDEWVEGDEPEDDMRREIRWAYGVLTVPERINDLLPQTLASLTAAGFDKPRLFVDGTNDVSLYTKFNLPVTLRGDPPLRPHGNWFMSLHELVIREPVVHRYAIFQDDIIAYKNLKTYLERTPYPENGYCNLFTFPSQVEGKSRMIQRPPPRHDYIGWYESNQLGLGALGLVFDRQAAVAVLASKHMVERPFTVEKGWRSVDGGIVTALKKHDPLIQEYIHSPSLLQHTGFVSSHVQSAARPTDPEWSRFIADTFRGEDFDAMELLECKAKQQV
jgi:hypothetical protein